MAGSASADSSPICPADTATTWVLEGDTCVGTTTETADAVYETAWECPNGYVEGPDFPADDSCVKYETEPVYDYQDATITGYECKAGKTYFEEPEPGCYQLTYRDHKWIWQITGIDPKPVYSCPDGWEEFDEGECRIQTGTEEVITGSTDPREVTGWMCPEGFTSEDDPITEESTCTRVTVERQTATCAAGDVLTNIGEGVYSCITPITPVTPTTTTGGTGPVYTAAAKASGGQELCLADGITTITITYDVAETGSGPTTDDAQYAANVATVNAVNASIAAQTPTGATLGACGAPVTTAPVVVSPVAPATVPQPETVSAPEAATVPSSVPAGDGSSESGLPMGALALLGLGMIGLIGSGMVAARSRP